MKKVSPFPLSQRLWCRGMLLERMKIEVGVDVGICNITFDFVNYANVYSRPFFFTSRSINP